MVQGKKIERGITESKFFSITCDGATDSSVQEQESIHTCYANCGIVEDHLVAFESAGASPNADGIWKAICRGISKVGITEDTMKLKMVSIALDGASVNIGKHHSVVKLAQKINPCIVPVHCFNHRLELAFWDTVKSLPIFKKGYILLQGLYNFYHYSPKQRQVLRDIAEEEKLTCIMPTRASGTRWISHWVTTLINMHRGYKTLCKHDSVCKHLESVPKVKGMYKIL